MVLSRHPVRPTDILSREPPLESSLHLTQIILLLTCLQWWWRDRQDFFAAGNLSIYYHPDPATRPRLKSGRKFRGPDFFVVLGTERRDRSSWIVSEEGGKFPNLIVEILSKGTAASDRHAKKALYQDFFKTPEYFWFDPRPQKLEFQGFCLKAGNYVEIPANDQGWRWSEELGLYLGIHNDKLRYFTADGVLVPNFEEETARQAATIALWQQRSEQEQHRAERLANYLRSQGIDPDTL
jgi:Uma2 family endonuclease